MLISGGGGGGNTLTGGGGGSSVSGNGKPATKPQDQQNDHCNNTAGSNPIELSQQSETLALTLFQLPGEMGLSYSLYYTSPRGWYDSLGYWLDLCTAGGTVNTNVVGAPGSPYPLPPSCTGTVRLHRPDGAELVFTGTSGTVGNYPVQGGSTATLTGNADGSYTLHDEDGTTQTYSSAGVLQSIKDQQGIGWTLSTSVVSGLSTTTVTATDGASFTVASQASTLQGVAQVTVTDPAGNVYVYSTTTPHPMMVGHNTFELLSLTLPGSPATTMSWKYTTGTTGVQYLLTEEDYNGAPYFYITYDSLGHATGSSEANGNRAFSIVYTQGVGTLTAAVTNPLGFTTTKQFGTQSDGEYMLTSVSAGAMADCGATTRSYAYDANGHETQSVDNDGVTHTYSYNANGQLQTETEAAGTAAARTTDYVWDPNASLNHLLSVTVEGVAKTAYTYNAQNRLASVTRTNLIGYGHAPLTTSYAYTQYANGMVQSMTVTAPSPNNANTTTYQYDSYGNLASVTDALGHVATYSGYNALGEVGKVVGPNGAEVDYTYDARGRVVTKTTHPNGVAATWTYTYDGFGLPASVSAPDGEVTTWTRDQDMRVTAITHNDKGGTSTEAFGYDANDDVTSDVVSRGGVVGKSTTYLYDALGRVYQAKGSNGQVLTYAYDGNANVLSVIDALGHQTRFSYDALNRVATATDAAGSTTRYAYDPSDHVTSVTDPRGLVTTYKYDGFGQLLNQVSPDTGTTTLTYDTYGRLASTTRADGTQTAYAYDALNRLTGATAGGITRTYLWDACNNGLGRLCAASTGTASVGYSYSPEGWVTGRAFALPNGSSYSLGYAYDSMGQLGAVDYPDGNVALYDYIDGSVADVRLTVNGASTNGITGVTYQPGGLAMSGWTSYNGLAHTIQYDSDLRPTSISVPNVESLAFTYDADDQITGITNGMNGAASQTLGYDADGRLTAESSTADHESYAYDADGNRITQTINGATTNFSYATGSNQLTATSGGAGLANSYGYDANGNTTTLNGSTAYGYGPFNRLVSANGASFTLDAEGQRLGKTFAGNATYFAPDTSGTLLAENDNGSWHDNVWLNGRLVDVIAGGKVYSVASDQTGRPVALTDPNTAIVWQATGLPFDRQVTANTFGDFNMGFPGQYHDAEDGLYQNGARDYDPATGRYIESDPIGLAGGVNTYAYVGGNPVSLVDPLGLDFFGKCLAQQYQKKYGNDAWSQALHDRVTHPGPVFPGTPAEALRNAENYLYMYDESRAGQWRVTGYVQTIGYAGYKIARNTFQPSSSPYRDDWPSTDEVEAGLEGAADGSNGSSHKSSCGCSGSGGG